MNRIRQFFLVGLVAGIGFAVVFTACEQPIEPVHTHQWGEWTVTTPAACTTAGEETRVCALDPTHKETRAIPIDPTAHQWGNWTQTKAPTETADGEETRTCTLDPAHKETRPIAALNHTHVWGEWTQTKAPTETEDGEETRTCTLNSAHKETRPIAALNHTHVWGNWEVTTPATCTTEGEETRVCTLDATHTETRPIAALGHDWGNWTQTTAPTCTTVGVETRICTHDVSHKETRPVAALGHEWGEWTVTTPATETAEGIETRVCAHDSAHKETRTVPRIPLFTSTSVTELDVWLTSQPANTAATAYTVALNVNDLGGSTFDTGSLGKALKDNNTKYVYLDLSGSTITSIGREAFSGCTSLTSITIPDSVTSIGANFFGDDDAYSVFQACNSLTAINVASGNTVYSSTDGILYNKDKSLLILCPPDKTGSIIIPNSVISIGGLAFRDCGKITSVTIPNGVTSIGWWAFGFCHALIEVTFEGIIDADGFSPYETTFPGYSRDLENKYLAEGPGTYTRISGGSTWTKQP